MKPDFLVPRSLLPSEKVIFLGFPYNKGEQRVKSLSLDSKHARCVQQSTYAGKFASPRSEIEKQVQVLQSSHHPQGRAAGQGFSAVHEVQTWL